MGFDPKINLASTGGQLDPNQPIDGIVTELMQTVHRQGKGFVLDLAPVNTQTLAKLAATVARVRANLADDNANGAIAIPEHYLGDLHATLDLAEQVACERGTSIEVKKSLDLHDEWERPVAYRKHEIRDTESFIGFARRYGTKEKSLVFYHENGAELVLDELVSRGKRELITMPILESDEWQGWSALLHRDLTHKELLLGLRKLEHTLEDATILLTMSSIRMNSTVNAESDLRDDGSSLGVAIKTSAGEEIKKFPKKVTIRVPVLEQDALEDKAVEAMIAVEIVMPDKPGCLPTFVLRCSIWKQIKRRRVSEEGKVIREALEGWTVVHGKHQQAKRRLGTEDSDV